MCVTVCANSEAEEELAWSTAQPYDYGPDDAFRDPINLTHRLLLIIHADNSCLSGHQMEVCLRLPLVCLRITVHLSHLWNRKQGYNVAFLQRPGVHESWSSCCVSVRDDESLAAHRVLVGAASDKVMHVHVSRYFGNTDFHIHFSSRPTTE